MSASKSFVFFAILLIKTNFLTTTLFAAYSPPPPTELDLEYESYATQRYEVIRQKEIALHQAVQTANTTEASRLLAENVDPNCILNEIPPLFHAIECKNWTLVLLLRLYGADPNLPSHRQDQQTPLQFAHDLLKKNRYVYVDAVYFGYLNVIRALTQEIDTYFPTFS